LKDFAVRDAQIVVVGARRHTLRISELIGAAALSEGVLSLEDSKVKAEADGIPVDLSARSIRADFVQAMLDLSEGRISVNGEKVSLSGRYGPGAQLRDGKISVASFRLPKLVEAARTVGLDLSAIRSGEVSGLSEVSYSEPAGLAVRTRELQTKNIVIFHRGSTYEASLMRGPVECTSNTQATGCTGDLVFEGFRFAHEATVVSKVSARRSSNVGNADRLILEAGESLCSHQGYLRCLGTSGGLCSCPRRIQRSGRRYWSWYRASI
jgi:hypothetical protein